MALTFTSCHHLHNIQLLTKITIIMHSTYLIQNKFMQLLFIWNIMSLYCPLQCNFHHITQLWQLLCAFNTFLTGTFRNSSKLTHQFLFHVFKSFKTLSFHSTLALGKPNWDMPGKYNGCLKLFFFLLMQYSWTFKI